MYADLYTPLPDADAYLERIGISRPQSPTAEFLDELVYAHQRSVPFENLDVYEHHLEPSLGIADLFEKVVVRKRGGYCFELNALFASLLASLGFHVQPAFARVLIRRTDYPLISHRANIVNVSGSPLLVDVGFGGPMPGFAPELADGFSRAEHGQAFTVHSRGSFWWDIGFTGNTATYTGKENIVLSVCAMPAEEHDFIPLSYYQSQNPQSAFRQNRMANIRTADGAIDLRNLTFTEYRSGKRSAREIAEDEVGRLLAERFGIVGW